MTVGELKAWLTDCGLSDDAVVLVPGRDHSYREAWPHEEDAVLEEGYHFSEYWDDHTEDSPGSVKVEALVFR